MEKNKSDIIKIATAQYQRQRSYIQYDIEFEEEKLEDIKTENYGHITIAKQYEPKQQQDHQQLMSEAQKYFNQFKREDKFTEIMILIARYGVQDVYSCPKNEDKMKEFIAQLQEHMGIIHKVQALESRKYFKILCSQYIEKYNDKFKSYFITKPYVHFQRNNSILKQNEEGDKQEIQKFNRMSLEVTAGLKQHYTSENQALYFFSKDFLNIMQEKIQETEDLKIFRKYNNDMQYNVFSHKNMNNYKTKESWKKWDNTQQKAVPYFKQSSQETRIDEILIQFSKDPNFANKDEFDAYKDQDKI